MDAAQWKLALFALLQHFDMMEGTTYVSFENERDMYLERLHELKPFDQTELKQFLTDFFNGAVTI